MRRFDNWIHHSFPITPEALGLYRMFFGAYALLVIAPGHDLSASLRTISTLPSTMFVPPPGPMMAFDGFPGAITAELLHLGVNLSLVALTFGFRTRVASLASGILLMLLYGFSYSLGKINHNLLFVLVPILLSFSNWGAAFSYDSRFARSSRRVETWPLTMLAVLVGFAMFTAGFAKIIGGWLDPETQAAFGHLVKHYLVRGRTDLLAPFLMSLRNGLLWEVVDYATVVFEIGFVAAVVRARWVRVFAALAVLFHFGVMLSLNIAFAFNLAAYAAFMDWDRVLRFFERLRFQWRPRITRGAAVSLLCSAGLTFYWFGSPLLWLDALVPLNSDLTFREVLTVSLAAVFVFLVGFRVAHGRLTNSIRS